MNIFGRDLGAVKEKLEAEWELVKFMGQEENTELREKLEDLEEDITDQQAGILRRSITIIITPIIVTNVDAQARKKTADEKLQLLNKLLVGIKSGLETVSRVDLYLFFFKNISLQVTTKLYAGEPSGCPPTR